MDAAGKYGCALESERGEHEQGTDDHDGWENRAMSAPLSTRPPDPRGFAMLHGVVHLDGTTDLFSRAADHRAADLSSGATSAPLVLRTLGVAWAAVAAAHLLAGIATWSGRPGWPRLLGWATLASLVLVVIALWASAIGLAIDPTLLAVAVAMRRGPAPGWQATR
jgi:hypothetical protein